MTQENEFIATLKAVREQMVRQRRDIIKALSGPFERGKTEKNRDLLTDVSGTIGLIDAAIKDEQVIAGTPQKLPDIAFSTPRPTPNPEDL